MVWALQGNLQVLSLSNRFYGVYTSYFTPNSFALYFATFLTVPGLRSADRKLFAGEAKGRVAGEGGKELSHLLSGLSMEVVYSCFCRMRKLTIPPLVSFCRPWALTSPRNSGACKTFLIWHLARRAREARLGANVTTRLLPTLKLVSSVAMCVSVCPSCFRSLSDGFLRHPATIAHKPIYPWVVLNMPVPFPPLTSRHLLKPHRNPNWTTFSDPKTYHGNHPPSIFQLQCSIVPYPIHFPSSTPKHTQHQQIQNTTHLFGGAFFFCVLVQ